MMLMSRFPEETIGEFLLTLSAILFSLSFIGSRYAMIAKNGSTIGPWTFNALHYSISCLVLILLEPLLRKHPLFRYSETTTTTTQNDAESVIEDTMDGMEMSNKREIYPWLSKISGVRVTRQMLMIILIQGSSNFIASILLQIGLMTLNVAKAAFITTCYVVVVPFVECLIPLVQGKSCQCVSAKTWAEVGICIIGVYLISGCTGTSNCLGGVEDKGEIYVVCSVIFWVINIIVCDEAGLHNDSIMLTVGDFALVAILTLIFSFFFEGNTWMEPTKIISSWFIIVFVGITEAIAYLLSTVGQIYVRPSRSAIIYTSESLFTCIGGFVFLGEGLTQPEILGGILIMLASLLSSLSFASDDDESEVSEHSSIAGEEVFHGQLGEYSPKPGSHGYSVGPRRSRAGSITRYHIIRHKANIPTLQYDRSRPIPILSSSTYRPQLQEPVRYGSVPTESYVLPFSVRTQLFSSSQ